MNRLRTVVKLLILVSIVLIALFVPSYITANRKTMANNQSQINSLEQFSYQYAPPIGSALLSCWTAVAFYLFYAHLDDVFNYRSTRSHTSKIFPSVNEISTRSPSSRFSRQKRSH